MLLFPNDFQLTFCMFPTVFGRNKTVGLASLKHFKAPSLNLSKSQNECHSQLFNCPFEVAHSNILPLALALKRNDLQQKNYMIQFFFVPRYPISTSSLYQTSDSVRLTHIAKKVLSYIIIFAFRDTKILLKRGGKNGKKGIKF